MAKDLYGITNKHNKWVFYQDGKLMAFDDVRIALAYLSRFEFDGGAPFMVRKIGDSGEPVDFVEGGVLEVKGASDGVVTLGRKK